MRLERFTRMEADPITVARRLLGQRLVRILDGQRLAGIIVEVEAYLGAEDRAAHTWNGRRTPRNQSMYLPGGHAYVYFTYGNHHCLNVVCGRKDEGIAVLIRALEPTDGLVFMQSRRAKAKSVRDLCSGPGKLTEALAIDRSLDGVDLRISNTLFIEQIRPRTLVKSQILQTPRIGLNPTAEWPGDWATRPLRFLIRQNLFVSR